VTARGGSNDFPQGTDLSHASLRAIFRLVHTSSAALNLPDSNPCLPELALRLQPGFGVVVLRASLLLPEAVGTQRNFVVRQFPVRAVGDEQRGRAFPGSHSFHGVVIWFDLPAQRGDD
jgi:hypothetical protein